MKMTSCFLCNDNISHYETSIQCKFCNAKVHYNKCLISWQISCKMKKSECPNCQLDSFECLSKTNSFTQFFVNIIQHFKFKRYCKTRENRYIVSVYKNYL